MTVILVMRNACSGATRRYAVWLADTRHTAGRTARRRLVCSSPPIDFPTSTGVATDEVRVRIETSISTNAESDRLMSKQLVRQRN